MLPVWGSTLALLQLAAAVLAAAALLPALSRAAVPLASLAGAQAASRRQASAVRSMLAGVGFTALAAAASTTV